MPWRGQTSVNCLQLRTYTRAPRLPSNVPIELYIKLALPVLKNFHRLPERATSPLEASPRTKNIFHHRLVEFPQAAAPWQEKFLFDTFRIVKDTSHVVLLRSKSPSSSSVTPVDKHVRDHPPYDQRYAHRGSRSLGYRVCVQSSANLCFQMAGSARSLTCGLVRQ